MNLRTRVFAAWAGVLLLFAMARVARAQNVDSSIQGTVTDSSKALIPGAEVRLTNVLTGVRLKTESDKSGNYSFPAVPPGMYSLQVSKQGFATYNLTQFNVIVGLHATENATLDVSSTMQSVTVEANGLANLLETQSNDLGNVIGPQSVAQLPLNGRNYLQLGLLSGTTQSNGGASNNTVAQTGHPFLSINIAGNEPDYTMYLVNGIQTLGTRAGNNSLNLSVSAIDQFEVHYGFFMPDMGTNPGIVDVITKSGTNQIHGEAYEFVRTNQMEAREYFNPEPPGPYHQNQFGFSLGGPILHNKFFYFWNYEGYRQNQSAFVGGYTPTQAMFSGDFSGLSTPIYDPASYNPTTGQRQQFPGNKIPASRINNTAKELLAFYLPGSSLEAKPNNIGGTPATTLDSDQITARLDYNLNENNQIFAQGSWINAPDTQPGLFPGQGTAYPLDTEYVALGWTSTLSATKVNSLRLGVVRDAVYDQGLSIKGIQNKLNITGTADPNGVPGINITGYSGFGTSTGLLGDVDNSYQIHDSFDWLHGNHQIKFGADLNYIRSVQSSANLNARGIFSFNDTYSAQTKPGPNGTVALVGGTGNPFADFLLGDPANAHSQGMPPTHYRWTEFEPYVQDTWKLRRDLTANLALAWYGTTPPNPPDKANRDLIHGFDFKTGEETFAALGTANPEVYPMTMTNVAPRIGLAWQPWFAKNTVVRAGWGMYYTTQMDFGAQYAVVSQIITVNNQVTNPANQPNPKYILGYNLLPSVTVGQITPAEVSTIKGAILYEDASSPTPQVAQWNLDVQHTFGKSYLLDVAYIGNEGHHLAKLFNPWDCSVPGSQICDTATEPFYGRYSYMQDMSSIGYGNYNGMLVKFQRQFIHGLTILGNYTLSKALSNANVSNNGTLSQDRSCLRCDKGMSPSNVPQSLVVSTVWNLPVGRGERFGANMNPILDGAIGGWNLDAIVTMQKGNPFTVVAPNHVAWPADQIRADRYCNGRSQLQNKNLKGNGYYWIYTGTVASVNSPCFVDPATDPHNTGNIPWSFGTSGFDILTGPGLDNWDLGIHKIFPIHDAMNFSLRGEFFNAWNHAQFANPDSQVTAATFGQVHSIQHAPREIQIAGTFSF